MFAPKICVESVAEENTLPRKKFHQQAGGSGTQMRPGFGRGTGFARAMHDCRAGMIIFRWRGSSHTRLPQGGEIMSRTEGLRTLQFFRGLKLIPTIGAALLARFLS